MLGAASAGPTWAGNWTIVPSISLRETLTDNVDLSPAGQAQSDLVSEVIPAISIIGEGGRFRLNLNYSFDALLYARTGSTNNENRSNLDAFGTLEAVENWFFIDARGVISQQSISAFGAPATSAASATANRTQTSTYELSPYLRGRFGDLATYDLRYSAIYSTSQTEVYGSSTTGTWSADLRGGREYRSMEWALTARQQDIDRDVLRDTKETRGQGFLTYIFSPEFRVSASAGYESNNFVTLDQDANVIYGGGLDWTPSPRTRLSLFNEKRFFGSGWNYSLTHRMPRSFWSYTDRKDTTTNATSQLGMGGGNALNLLSNILTTQIPDEGARTQEAQRLLEQGGIPASVGAASSVATPLQYVVRSQDASVAMMGVRNTVTLSAFRYQQRQLFLGSQDLGDFSGLTAYTEKGIGANWSLRVTPITSLSVTGRYSRTNGSAAAVLENDQWQVNALLTTSFGQRTSGSLGARYAVFNTTTPGTTDYRETAVFGALTYRF